MTNPDGKPTQRLKQQPRSSGTYSITRKAAEDTTKIAVIRAGDEIAITVDKQHLTLSRSAAKRLVVSLLEVID